MEEHCLDKEDFEKENKYQEDPHLPAPLPMKNDYLSSDHYLDLEETDQVDQGERDH